MSPEEALGRHNRLKRLRKLNRYLVSAPTELAKKVMMNEVRRSYKRKKSPQSAPISLEKAA